MTNKEKYLAFLNEHIEKAFSVETTSAYELCKAKFEQIFKEEISLPEQLKITDERRLDMLTGALEGGSNYWYWIGNQAAATINNYGIKANSNLFVDRMMAALQAGEKIEIRDAEYEETILGTISMESIEAGEMKMFSNEDYEDHYMDIIKETDDATTADIWFQFAVLGEVVYG